ncbi:hypothetical protein [Alkalihalobacterium elongatum]|uniref:hypothetical protein n=1 Tax=Alkalihalobacterium elongatum TaxID=2675466 RepID=UPI001C1F2AB2|nr:hypothetical protein [Alkalihalobacterium elongatum]
MSNAGERALAAASQLEKIGFVDFTVDLVRGVYQVILNGSMEQLNAYADFVSKVAKTLEEYQAEVLGASTEIELNQKADQYIKEIFQLGATTTTHSLSENTYLSMKEHFSGVTMSDSESGRSKSFDDYVKGSDGNKTISHQDLSLLVVEKLKQSAKESYDLIKSILKIGMQKVVITNGEINTKLTFHVDANDTTSKTSNTYNTRSSNWGIGGSMSGNYGVGIVDSAIGNYIGGRLSGGYRSSKLNVNVVNEKSTSATNVNIDVLGSVKIQFRTETFPSIDS